MTVLAFLKVGNFCVFFQINTKIAHLLATAEFKLLPPGGQFLCVLPDHTLKIQNIENKSNVRKMIQK